LHFNRIVSHTQVSSKRIPLCGLLFVFLCYLSDEFNTKSINVQPQLYCFELYFYVSEVNNQKHLHVKNIYIQFNAQIRAHQACLMYYLPLIVYIRNGVNVDKDIRQVSHKAYLLDAILEVICYNPITKIIPRRSHCARWLVS